MDPQSCFDLWLRAIAKNEIEEAQEVAEDLRTWLRMGGFKPSSWVGAPDQERIFNEWCGEFLQ